MPASGGEPRRLADVGGRRAPLAWSADSPYIYFGGPVTHGKRALLLLSADGGEPQPTGLTVPAGRGVAIRRGRVAWLDGAITAEVRALENFLPK